MNNTKVPLISVITVSYNAVDIIEETILSVINQNFTDYEYIIVDGGSTDGTVDVIKKYQDKITLWFSEPDKGIYDAMNKGVKLAKGDWVNFMNAGDSFYGIDVLYKLKLKFAKDVDIVYGSINCITKSNSFILKPKPFEKIIYSMVFCHQAVFVKRKILEKYRFDISFKIAADYKLFRQLFIEKYRFHKTDTVVANYEAEEGVSSTSFYMMEKEYAIIKGDWDKTSSKVSVFLKAEIYILLSKMRNMVPLQFRKYIRNEIFRN